MRARNLYEIHRAFEATGILKWHQKTKKVGKQLIWAIHSYLTREYAKECMNVIIHKSHNIMQY